VQNGFTLPSGYPTDLLPIAKQPQKNELPEEIVVDADDDQVARAPSPKKPFFPLDVKPPGLFDKFGANINPLPGIDEVTFKATTVEILNLLDCISNLAPVKSVHSRAAVLREKLSGIATVKARSQEERQCASTFLCARSRLCVSPHPCRILQYHCRDQKRNDFTFYGDGQDLCAVD
jgi:hypothetical protein